MDIWDRFRREAVNVENRQSKLILIGDRRAGKSTIVARFIDQSPSNKPTIALEYLYARKGNSLCHIWEAGGEFNSSTRKMIEVPLQSNETDKILFCIVLDLEHPNRLEDIALRAAKFIQNERKKRTKENVNVLIVAHKFDKYSSRPNSEKTTINTFLRALTLSLDGHLIQCSNNSESQMLKLKKMLNYLIFQSGNRLNNEIDVNKSLVVWEDSWDSIGVRNLDKAVVELSRSIKQERVKSSELQREPPNSERFLEPKIDSAIEQYRNFTKYKTLVHS